MTNFVVLYRSADDDHAGWRERGNVEAHNAEAAVRASFLKNPAGGITSMVAVPERSWRPVAIRTEKQPDKLILGEPKAPALPPVVSGGDAA